MEHRIIAGIMVVVLILFAGCSNKYAVTAALPPVIMVQTMTVTPTATQTSASFAFPTFTVTSSPTGSAVVIPVFSATSVDTPVHSATRTLTMALTPSFTQTVTQTATPDATSTATRTATRTFTATPCVAGNVAYIQKNYETMSTTNYTFTAKSQAELNSLNFGFTMDPVDFNTKMVVGYVYMRNNSCYSDSLLGIQTNCSKITVNVYEKSSCPAQTCADGYVVRCVLAVINKSNLPVQFNFTYNTCP